MGTLTSYVGALDAAKSSLNGSAGFSWINIRARGYCNDYEDEDELKLNSAQHARSAASRLDDVIDRSALEQAREGFRRPGYRGAAHWTRSPKEHS
jgi:hypothetical protein